MNPLETSANENSAYNLELATCSGVPEHVQSLLGKSGNRNIVVTFGKITTIQI